MNDIRRIKLGYVDGGAYKLLTVSGNCSAGGTHAKYSCALHTLAWFMTGCYFHVSVEPEVSE